MTTRRKGVTLREMNRQQLSQHKKEIPKCQFCNKIAFKTNGKSEYECENRANYGDCDGLKPHFNEKPKQKRNSLCNCNSGKKAKYCCDKHTY